MKKKSRHKLLWLPVLIAGFLCAPIRRGDSQDVDPQMLKVSEEVFREIDQVKQNLNDSEIESEPHAAKYKEKRDATCKIIYLGFVGLGQPPGYKGSGIVKIRDILLTPAYPDVCAKSYMSFPFIPFSTRPAAHWVEKHFPMHPGALSPDEIANAPKVIIAGHSMGGWAALSVARNLRAKGIPVELTVQVDSVGITDLTVPHNVKGAAMFHAHDFLWPITTHGLKLQDPRTEIVMNKVVAHAGHLSITRNKDVCELILGTVNSLRPKALQVQTQDNWRQLCNSKTERRRK